MPLISFDPSYSTIPGDNERVSSSVFQRSPIIIVVDSMGEIKLQLEFQKLHEFKGNFHKTHIQSSMILPECMNLTEIVLTTIFSVKLMHDCTL